MGVVGRDPICYLNRTDNHQDILLVNEAYKEINHNLLNKAWIKIVL